MSETPQVASRVSSGRPIEKADDAAFDDDADGGGDEEGGGQGDGERPVEEFRRAHRG